ncbi:hypothetical protein BKA81DRAFT_358657 [Phyllosticta paracitricarpa]
MLASVTSAMRIRALRYGTVRRLDCGLTFFSSFPSGSQLQTPISKFARGHLPSSPQMASRHVGVVDAGQERPSATPRERTTVSQHHVRIYGSHHVIILTPSAGCPFGQSGPDPSPRLSQTRNRDSVGFWPTLTTAQMVKCLAKRASQVRAKTATWPRVLA